MGQAPSYLLELLRPHELDSRVSLQMLRLTRDRWHAPSFRCWPGWGWLQSLQKPLHCRTNPKPLRWCFIFGVVTCWSLVLVLSNQQHMYYQYTHMYSSRGHQRKLPQSLLMFVAFVGKHFHQWKTWLGRFIHLAGLHISSGGHYRTSYTGRQTVQSGMRELLHAFVIL